jgi:RimJ/RimL family protein N-acetyltransferase
MATADMALTGAGVTASELCAFGVPAVLLVLAENQEPVVDAIEAAGAAVRAHVDDPAGMARTVSALVEDQERRATMAAAGRRLVDGRGALRVAARLRGDLLVLRPATDDDIGLLFEWVNDPLVRSAALVPGAISWETHVAWFTSKLADDACNLSIVEVDGVPVGQVRVDGLGDEVEISIGLDPSARGLRLGPAVIDAAVRRTFATTAATRVLARIRPSNARSVIAFGDAGFTPDGEGTDGRVTWLRYARTR